MPTAATVIHGAPDKQMRCWLALSLSILALASAAPAAAQPASSASGSAPAETTYHVLVSGEVRLPGRVTLTAATMTVRDAIIGAGMLTVDAAESVVVLHTPSPGAAPERRTIALKDLEEGTPGIDVSLYDGDVVTVPTGERFYVSGFVQHPGAYRLWAGTTVSQAITLAGGVAATGTSRGLKIHRSVNGKPVDVTPKPDDLVLPNDELKVPRRLF